jgi:coproporphyrinogen III oxidase-like Fe-S oxidoreductase
MVRADHRMIRLWGDVLTALASIVLKIPFIRSRIQGALYRRAAASFGFPHDAHGGDLDNLIADGACCVYVHFPFCSSACKYCSFSKTLKTDHVQEYCESVVREIDLFGQTRMRQGTRLTSVYFGGGTPSLIPPVLLAKICSRILEQFPHDARPQITLECNPDSLDPDLAGDYVRMGINRLSVGVQSFNPETLAEMGRTPHPDHILHVLKALPDKGLANFSVDLMYGFESQSRETFLADLRQAIDIGSEHITVYPLVSAHRASAGARQRERAQEKLYRAAQEVLADAGYEQYSTEDFARHADGRDRYEMDSWKVPSKGVVVFGTAGFGTLNHRFYTKERDIAAFTGSVDQGRFASASCRLIEKKKEARIRMLLGLRYLNVDRKAFGQAHGLDPWSGKDEMLNLLKGLGLVQADDACIRLHENAYFKYSLLWAKIMLGRLDGNI